MKRLKIVLSALILVVLVGAAGAAYKLYQGRAFIWLPDYFTNSPTFSGSDSLVDVIFVVVDHWEPGGKMDIVNRWMTDYADLAKRHIDADGIPLQHTWYYPLDQFRGQEVDSLVRLCREGLGDVEVHLHHFDDNSETLRRKFLDGLDSLRAHGALVSSDSVTRFSFIHGNWALDNSGVPVSGGRLPCGVDDELSILMELGCYSDCTFPAMGQSAQPSWVNKIYYATDDPARPKSHDTGVLAEVGKSPQDDQLLILEGPYMIDWSDWRFKTHPVFDDGNLYWEIPTSLHRFELWLEANVHVKGRPNWIFVRPFTHGADLRNGGDVNILGSNLDEMLTGMENNYNDGKKYRLHYMTAREAYNVVKAAEAGLDGNPNDFRDYEIKPYVYPRPETRAEDVLPRSETAVDRP